MDIGIFLPSAAGWWRSRRIVLPAWAASELIAIEPELILLLPWRGRHLMRQSFAISVSILGVS